MSDYKVALEVYNGPLDLLLFLIRRDEIDIYDIPIARITQQYLAYVDVLRDIDPDAVGEFLVLAATLMEIKSRTLLPTPPVDEAEEDIADPRMELVRQLLEYKKFKDAARELEDAATVRAMRHARQPAEPPVADDEGVELENLEIWDLFEAFQRLLEQTGKAGGYHQVQADDTPIALYADDILDAIQRSGGAQRFEEIFHGRTRPEMIGLFLALLELIRQKRIRATQERPFAAISIVLLDASPLDEVEDLDQFYRPLNAEEALASRAGAGAPEPESNSAAWAAEPESDNEELPEDDEFLQSLGVIHTTPADWMAPAAPPTDNEPTSTAEEPDQTPASVADGEIAPAPHMHSRREHE